MTINNGLTFGVDYYPEHWPRDRWERDAALMREAGLSVVRVAEFAWSKIEAREGNFNWDWLDTAIEVLHNAGLQVIIGTPSATPPAWLAQKYPEILPVLENGQRVSFGGRRHYCPSSRVYRQLVERFVRAEAEHYQNNAAVIGWQIDNEMGNHGNIRCYCDSCEVSWRIWLQHTYKTLDNLNQAWGTIFWSHEYSDWSQIPLPRPALTSHTPSLMLDYYRFASQTAVDFVNQQVETLREYFPDPSQSFITSNIFYGEDNINFYDMFARTDFAAWDNYPQGMEAISDIAFYHDYMWGLKQRGYWVMEQQLGPVNWTKFNPPLPPGQARLWTYQDFLKGCEAVVYFRWRESRFGQEQYHSAFLRHDASPNRGFAEIQATAKEIAALPKELWQRPRAKVALLYSYDDNWTLQIEPHNAAFNYLQLLKDIYHNLWRHGIACDILPRGSDSETLKNYALVIAPAPIVSDDREARIWHNYVEAGGKLLAVTRGGAKLPSNIWTDQPMPHGLTDLFGLKIGELLSFAPPAPHSESSLLGSYQPSQAEPLELKNEGGIKLEARRLWGEILEIDSAQPLLRYGKAASTDFFENATAMARHDYGDGAAYYLAVWPEESLYDYLWTEVFSREAKSVVPAGTTLPADVEAIACGQRGQFLALLNHSDTATILNFPTTLRRIDCQQALPQATHVLPPYGIAIFALPQ